MTMFHLRLVRSIALLTLGSILTTSCLPGANIPGSSPGQNNNTSVAKVDDTIISCETIPAQNSSRNNSVLNIEIHVDGSGSMLGYATVPNSRYIKTLEAVDQTFSLSSIIPTESVKVNYFRTGFNKSDSKSLHPLDRSLFQRARSAEFYTGVGNSNFPPISSQVNKAIESLDSDVNKLIVLISDMGQDDGDVTRILQSIRNNVFLSKETKKTNAALAIVGIKSEFDGKVHSPTNPTQSYPYSTLGKPTDSYRPFYLLIAGPASNVQYFLDKLETSIKSLIPDIFQVVNSSDLDQNQSTIEASLFDINLLPALTFQNTIVESKRVKNIQEVYALRNRNLALRLSSESNSKALIITTNQPISQNYKVSLFNNNLDSQDRELGNLVVPSSLVAESSIQTFDPSTGTFLEATENSPIILNSLNFKFLNPLELSFDLQISPADLITENIYVYKVRFRAKELTQHDWWTEWDTSEEQNWNQGNKTYKLFNFLTGLNSLTSGFMETGELCYAIQRK